MMRAARVRIGRVRMKNGGADVRVLHANPRGRITDHMRGLIAHAESFPEQPSAYVGIVFWRCDDEPWRPSFALSWDTIDPNLPLPRLMRAAAAEIEPEAAILRAEAKIMRRLGYERSDDPDPAA